MSDRATVHQLVSNVLLKRESLRAHPERGKLVKQYDNALDAVLKDVPKELMGHSDSKWSELTRAQRTQLSEQLTVQEEALNVLALQLARPTPEERWSLYRYTGGVSLVFLALIFCCICKGAFPATFVFESKQRPAGGEPNDDSSKKKDEEAQAKPATDATEKTSTPGCKKCNGNNPDAETPTPESKGCEECSKQKPKKDCEACTAAKQTCSKCKQDETEKEESKPEDNEACKLKPEKTPSKDDLDSKGKTEKKPSISKSPDPTITDEQKKSEGSGDSDEECHKPVHAAWVWLMVVAAGGFGGCMRMSGSLTRYLGEDQFRRTWLPYYYAMPLEGMGLALIVGLLFAAGLLSPNGQEPGDECLVSDLLLLYGMAGIAGMFAKNVTQKLKDLAVALFGQSSTKDTTAQTSSS